MQEIESIVKRMFNERGLGEGVMVNICSLRGGAIVALLLLQSEGPRQTLKHRCERSATLEPMKETTKGRLL